MMYRNLEFGTNIILLNLSYTLAEVCIPTVGFAATILSYNTNRKKFYSTVHDIDGLG